MPVSLNLIKFTFKFIINNNNKIVIFWYRINK